MRFATKEKGKKEQEIIKKTEELWNSKEKEIVNLIQERTGLTLPTKKVTCNIDFKHKEGYYGEKEITIGNYKNTEDTLLIITHELIHIAYWKKIKELQLTTSNMGTENKEEWKLTETIAHLITTDKNIRTHWKNINIEPYPECKEQHKKLLKEYQKQPFETFLKKVYNHINTQ